MFTTRRRVTLRSELCLSLLILALKLLRIPSIKTIHVQNLLESAILCFLINILVIVQQGLCRASSLIPVQLSIILRLTLHHEIYWWVVLMLWWCELCWLSLFPFTLIEYRKVSRVWILWLIFSHAFPPSNPLYFTIYDRPVSCTSVLVQWYWSCTNDSTNWFVRHLPIMVIWNSIHGFWLRGKLLHASIFSVLPL